MPDKPIYNNPFISKPLSPIPYSNMNNIHNINNRVIQSRQSMSPQTNMNISNNNNRSMSPSSPIINNYMNTNINNMQNRSINNNNITNNMNGQSIYYHNQSIPILPSMQVQNNSININKSYTKYNNNNII